MSPLEAEPGTNPIIVESHYTASPERVYRAWTDPEQVKRWFGSQAGDLHEVTIDLRPRGKWRFIEQAEGAASTGFEGEYLEIVPNELLIFTWAKVSTYPNEGPETTPYSRVEIRFEGTSHGTMMRIVHSNLDPETRAGFRAGWSIGTANLARHLQP